VLVRVTVAGDRAQVVAEAMTDARGMVRFDVPPGDYWVYAPLEAPQALMDQEPAGNLPDGTTVYAWTQVVVRAKNSIDATLTLLYQQS
jgi:hypothetical protein